MFRPPSRSVEPATSQVFAFTAGMASWDECKAARFDAHFLKTDRLPRLSRTIRR